VTDGVYRLIAVATDDCGLATTSAAADVTVIAPVAIVTASVASGQTGTTYSVTLDASGGRGSYAWSLAAGQLPPGLSLGGSSGVIAGVPLQPGTFPFTVRAADASDGSNAATRAYTVTVAYTGAALPGMVQAEDFDDGGEGVGYHDLTTGNTGGAYRATDVDIEPTTDTGGGYNIGWMRAGEWLEYTVTVAAAGTYAVSVRVAVKSDGGTFHVEFGGVDKTGPLKVPNTGGWQTWTTVRKTVTLAAGTQVMRLVLDANGSTGVFGNVNYLEVIRVVGTLLPARVQAEDFDGGGEGVAYHDTTTGNTGCAYRATDVDLQATTDVGGGYNIGWMVAGEWLKYTVTVAAAGTYAVSVRVAVKSDGGTFHVEFGGVDKTGPLTVPSTGGWQTWTTVTKTVTLGAGTQTMRLVLDASGATGVFGNVNYIAVAAAP
jgi:hypothetical protein